MWLPQHGSDLSWSASVSGMRDESVLDGEKLLSGCEKTSNQNGLYIESRVIFLTCCERKVEWRMM